MNVKEIFDNINLQICNCEPGKRYFDPFRNIYVCVTPEEKVRQKTCLIMFNKLGAPKKAIRVEDHLIHYGVKEKNGRMDIVLTFIDLNGNELPLAVIECKEERVPVIAQQVKEQAANYASYIGAPYFIVTNGVEMYYYRLNKNRYMYEAINELLTYQDMMDSNYTLTKNTEIFKRLDYSEYYDIKKLKSYEWIHEKIGEDTKDEFIPSIINLDDCLLDRSRSLTNLNSKKYGVIKDLGVQYRNYNDASGGGFGSGFYRVIKIKDKRSHKEFLVGFTITTTGKVINDPHYGTSDGKSVFIIMKNDGDRDDMAVQINMNKCLMIKEKKTTIKHNALITKKGKTKKGLLEYINSKNKNLVKGQNIILGTLDCSKYLYMNNNDVAKFLDNAIEYAVHRNKYKNC